MSLIPDPALRRQPGLAGAAPVSCVVSHAMRTRVLVALVCALVTVVLQGCSVRSGSEADAARFFQSQCLSCSAVVAHLDEDEVAAQTFTVRYRRPDGTAHEASVLFLRESASWSVVQ